MDIIMEKTKSKWAIPKDIDSNKAWRGKSDLFFERRNRASACSLSYLVCPHFTFLHFIGFFPSSIAYDKDKQLFVLKNGNCFRKVISLCIYLSVMVYLVCALRSITAATLASGISSDVVNLYKILFFFFICFDTSIMFVLWTKGKAICDILNAVDDITLLLKSDGCLLPSKLSVQKSVWLIIILYSTLALIYSQLVEVNPGLWRSPSKILHTAGKRAIADYSRLFETKRAEDFSEIALISIGIGYSIQALLNALGWMIGCLMTLLWAFLFVKLFNIFFRKLNQGGDLLHDIRTFNAMTVLIEKFNRVFSPTIFFNTVAAVLYISINMWSIFTGSGNPVRSVVMTLSFVPFFALIICSSEVNNVGTRLAYEIKCRHMDLFNWTTKYQNSSDMTQSLLIVFRDMQSGTIGFRGLNFFTISYGFVGTVVGLIVTYSMMTYQFVSQKSPEKNT